MIDAHVGMKSASIRRRWYVVAMIAGLPVVVFGRPPREPLPAPVYSFSLDSPAVQQGHVAADSVLELNDPYPVSRTAGVDLGLGLMGDDLDALSSDNRGVSEEEPFILLFSVDAYTQGLVDPDEEFIHEDVGYNVKDQWRRGHQAGDLFMVTLPFDRGGERPQGDEERILNNVLVRNNYDEGGTDYSARPETSAFDIVPLGPQDRVDATANDLGGPMYYSAGTSSPSLWYGLPGSRPSGANIFCRESRGVYVFAVCTDLGLTEWDDIDAIVVFDSNEDGVFNDSDQVLFSLTPDSLSLGTFPGSSAAPAADVLSVRPGEAPVVFATSTMLGLGAPTDNIDALDIYLCDDIEDCAEDHGIRLPDGWDDDEDDDDDDDDEHSIMSGD